jgi:hypothetical protein
VAELLRKNIRVFVDKIENGFADLLIGDEETGVSWPLEHLPEQVKEGDIFKVSFEKDDQSKKQTLDEISSLIDEMDS